VTGMRAGRERRHGTASATIPPRSETTPGGQRTPHAPLTPWARRNRTPGGSTTCTGTSGSGVPIVGPRVTTASRLLRTRRGQFRALSVSCGAARSSQVCCAAACLSPAPSTRTAVHTAASTTRTAAPTLLGFVLRGPQHLEASRLLPVAFRPDARDWSDRHPRRVRAGRPGQRHRVPRCQDSVMLWHLAVLPFAVSPSSLLPRRAAARDLSSTLRSRATGRTCPAGRPPIRVPANTVPERLGHSQISVTARHLLARGADAATRGGGEARPTAARREPWADDERGREERPRATRTRRFAGCTPA
jgi:hypothetical protein